MRVDLAWQIVRPGRTAVVAACFMLAACNQASPSPPVATESATPSVVASPGASGSAVASPGMASASPTASQDVAAGTTPPDGAGASAEAGPADLRIVEAGFTAFSDDGNDFASFAAIVDNPNRRWAAFQMQVTIDFFDADDAFIAGEELFVRVLPGQRTAIAGEAFGAGRATRMTVNLPDDTTAFEPDRTSSELFRISEVETVRRDGLNVARGRLTSQATATASGVQLIAVYRGVSGAIIGGAVGGVDSVAPGATVTFEVIDSAPYPTISNSEAYWQMSGVRR